MELARLLVNEQYKDELVAFANVTERDLEYWKEKGLDYQHNLCVSVTTQNPNTHVGQFWLAAFPGCCGIVVSNNKYIRPGFVGSRWGGANFHRLQEEVAKKLGYSAMIATTQLSNIPEIVSATTKGKYKVLRTFKNKRTDNELALMFKEIK